MAEAKVCKFCGKEFASFNPMYITCGEPQCKLAAAKARKQRSRASYRKAHPEQHRNELKRYSKTPKGREKERVKRNRRDQMNPERRRAIRDRSYAKKQLAQNPKWQEIRCLKKQLDAFQKCLKSHDPEALRSFLEEYGTPTTSGS